MAGEVIAAALEGTTLERPTLSTTDARKVRVLLDEYVSEHLDAVLSDCFFAEISVGAVFGVEVDDGRRAALKIHQPSVGEDFLREVVDRQSELADAGFPCPTPLAWPARRGGRMISAEEWVDGERGDAFDPAVRRELAAGLARQIDLLRGKAGGVLPRTIASETWPPTPHNALFDFSRTDEETRRIDSLARNALARVGVGSHVVGHGDWSVKHARFARGRLHVVYDWDSIRHDRAAGAGGARGGVVLRGARSGASMAAQRHPCRRVHRRLRALARRAFRPGRARSCGGGRSCSSRTRHGASMASSRLRATAA